ncbi:F-box/kelch-repeat protein At3g06240-like [Cornus florida]|uniref:F-box/kelch-repeat protein At3g06240-like n=1 Tax=Cornus florida TaxID=4283 RepID=UPI00289CFFC5|nr:F-box/kelch-repeat protein At3g06240-like [Cornus florida]
MSSNGGELPQELVFDILSRLPAKSLCRFKCVSKPWHSLISDPYFAKTHLNNHRRERLIFMSYKSLYSVDCTEASSSSKPFPKCNLDLNQPPQDAVIATEIDFPPIEHHTDWFEILGSCDGLLLVVNEVDRFLLNPSTREFKKLPKCPPVFNSLCTFTMCGLGYDSSADDYKFVTVAWDTDTCVIVYSMKTGSWRSIQDVPYECSLVEDFLAETSWLVLANGSLHWLTFRSSDGVSVIAAFDVADENFHDVPTPRSLENYVLGLCELGVFGGCLCLLIQFVSTGNSNQTDVWVMKEYGVAESWTKFTIDLPQERMMMRPLCFLVDGEVLLETDGDKLVAFNVKDKTSRGIAVCGMPAAFTGRQTYVESLVSPSYKTGIKRKYEGSERLEEL